MIKRLAPALLMPMLLLLNVSAEAFVGGITVSIGRAANEEGAEIAPFSADAQVETEENQLTSKVYYKAGKVRDDTNMGGMQMVTIQRFDEGKVWVLMGQGMYMESEIGQSQQAPEYKLIERSVVGKEKVDGMQTTKYKTIYEGPDGRMGGFTWFTDDNIAVKGFMVSETKGKKQRLRWTLSNVQRGDQPDSLFELPPGARKMGGMPGMSGLTGMSTPGAGNPAMPHANPAAQETPSADEPSVVEEVAGDAAETAKQATKQETNNAVRQGVREGFRKLFGR
ncbi:MAG: hypothetical protein R3E86_06200 [Pseudomonadales bacterium]